MPMLHGWSCSRTTRLFPERCSSLVKGPGSLCSATAVNAGLCGQARVLRKKIVVHLFLDTALRRCTAHHQCARLQCAALLAQMNDDDGRAGMKNPACRRFVCVR